VGNKERIIRNDRKGSEYNNTIIGIYSSLEIFPKIPKKEKKSLKFIWF